MTRVLSLVTVACVCSIAAADVIHVADETTTGSGWRTATVAKPNDVDGNNVYGTDGWVFFGWEIAGLAYGDGGFVNPAQTAKDRESLPSYISSVTYGGPNGNLQWGGSNGFAAFDDPINPGSTRTGSVVNGRDGYDLVVTVTRPTGSPAFRLTAFVSCNLSGYSESITASDGAASDSTMVAPAAGAAQYVLFDIGAGSSDIMLTLHEVAVDNAMLTGLAFDHQVPEPSTCAMVGATILGLFAYAWRKQK